MGTGRLYTLHRNKFGKVGMMFHASYAITMDLKRGK